MRDVHPDPDLDFLPIPDPGSRGQKGTGSRITDRGSRIRIRNTEDNYKPVNFVPLLLRKEKEAALEREIKLEEEKLWAQVAYCYFYVFLTSAREMDFRRFDRNERLILE